MTDYQYGFTREKSTNDVTTKLLNDAYYTINDNTHFGVFSQELSKDFHTVDFEILIKNVQLWFKRINSSYY